ncbi:type II secretion system protein N [Thiofilum flexile]|uniref:type II secretion system protein N n=1 Tax=Thiofilum flexile TaxID=125627 RepID=UPI000377560C|nr:type II secretion system protein N [Thiofilum flexile]
MKKILLFLLIGLLSYGLSLVMLAPLSVIWPYLPKPEGLQVGGVKGLLWQGEAYNIQLPAPNSPMIRQFSWDFQPRLLLQGQLAFQWQIQTLGGNAQGNCGFNWRTQVQCQTLEWDLPANVVKSLAPDYAVIIPNLAGQLRGNAFDFTWSPQNLPQFTGQIRWDNPETLTGVPMNLGKAFKMALTGDETGIKGFATSEQTSIDITGSQLNLTPNGHYQVETVIHATPETNPRLRQNLDMLFGMPQADGTYRQVLEGEVILPTFLRK